MTADDPVIHITSSQHSSSVVASLNLMLQDQQLLDCSLVCDGRVIRAHRVILSASCGYFRTAFTSFPSSMCQNTAVIVNDISFKDLETIINFIYEGKVKCEISRIPSLIRSSQCLQVNSLYSELSAIAACAVTSSPATVPLSPLPSESISNSSLQNLRHITRNSTCTPQRSWTTTDDSPIIFQALAGVRMEAAPSASRACESFESAAVAETSISDMKHEDQYSSSEEIEIPARKIFTPIAKSMLVLEEERLPVDLSSNGSGTRRFHVKPRDLYANGTLSRHVRASSFSVGQKDTEETAMDALKGLSANGRTSSQSSVDPAGDTGLRSDSLSSGENVTLKRGRGRPPRHSLDDEMRGSENRTGCEVIPVQLMDEVLGYKRLKLNALGLPASVRGRKPKLSYSGNSRDVSGKNRCPFCPQVYYSTQAMNDHISNVHSKNALKYGCKFCSKEFSWKISLNKHLRKQHPLDTSKPSSS